MTPFIRLHPNDDVLIARQQLVGGTQVEGITTRGLVPPGHKVATRPIPSGSPIVKFGQVIGYATADIAPGAHVHVHNCAMGGHDQDYKIGVDYRPVQYREPMGATFKGIRRPDGRVGTRNFIALCSTVNCSSFSPLKWVSLAVNGCSPLCVSRCSVQYSRGTKASISSSRSTIMRRAGDCTRPALKPGLILRHSSGDRLKPTR